MPKLTISKEKHNNFVSYKKLWVLLVEKELKKKVLVEDIGLSENIVARMGKNYPVSLMTLYRICEYFKVDLADICEFKLEGIGDK